MVLDLIKNRKKVEYSVEYICDKHIVKYKMFVKDIFKELKVKREDYNNTIQLEKIISFKQLIKLILRKISNKIRRK